MSLEKELDEMRNQHKFGAQLKELREKRGLTQKELAKKIGVTPLTISRYETGNSKPDLNKVLNLANALFTGENELDYYSLIRSYSQSLFLSMIENDYGLSENEIAEVMGVDINTYQKYIDDSDNEKATESQLDSVLTYIAKKKQNIKGRKSDTDIISGLMRLNEKGLKKVGDYINDLLLIQKYVINDKQESLMYKDWLNRQIKMNKYVAIVDAVEKAAKSANNENSNDDDNADSNDKMTFILEKPDLY